MKKSKRKFKPRNLDIPAMVKRKSGAHLSKVDYNRNRSKLELKLKLDNGDH